MQISLGLIFFGMISTMTIYIGVSLGFDINLFGQDNQYYFTGRIFEQRQQLDLTIITPEFVIIYGVTITSLYLLMRYMSRYDAKIIKLGECEITQ